MGHNSGEIDNLICEKGKELHIIKTKLQFAETLILFKLDQGMENYLFQLMWNGVMVGILDCTLKMD